jgi:formiminoglutamase
MKLPILVSVPHAGLLVPEEAQPFCRLTHEEIVADGDKGAADIYAIADEVAQFVTTDVARAIVDLNRAQYDFRADGVIKTHTCWNVPVYRDFPRECVVNTLLQKYYHPYHRTIGTPDAQVRLCVDCHTMAAVGPPIGPDSGTPRPHVCLGDACGTTLPNGWMDGLVECFQRAFDETVEVNTPFSGGHITRTHGQSRPWVQVELSRAAFATDKEKRSRVLHALTDFCRRVL